MYVKPVNIVFEGIGAVGKTTSIQFIKLLYTELFNCNYVEHHFTYPKGDNQQRQIGYQHGQFELAFDFINKLNINNIGIILDRFHVGEYIWSPQYRNYDPKYLQSLEDQYLNDNYIFFHIKADPKLVWQRLVDRKEDIRHHDPYFNLYDSEIKAIEDTISKFDIQMKRLSSKHFVRDIDTSGSILNTKSIIINHLNDYIECHSN